MNLSILKIFSALSALLVFFPNQSGVLFPFGIVLAEFENFTSWKTLIPSLIVLISFLYIIYSAYKGLANKKNRTSKIESFLTILPLLAFLILLAYKSNDFINYANWLSISTGIIAAIVILLTTILILKETKTANNS
jgi:hypothetical protein